MQNFFCQKCTSLIFLNSLDLIISSMQVVAMLMEIALLALAFAASSPSTHALVSSGTTAHMSPILAFPMVSKTFTYVYIT